MAGTGGSGGGGGSTGGGGANQAAVPSEGCGKTAPAPVTTEQTIDVSGTSRKYNLNVPTNYDPNHPYRLLFVLHGQYGNDGQYIKGNDTGYGSGPLSNGSVIFVAPQGLGNPTGWANTGGQDVALVRALLDRLNGTYCIDKSRIFAAGISYGGNFSNTLGCTMGDVFRAIFPIAGWGPQGGGCVGKPAGLFIHGTADTTINISQGQASRDRLRTANHCAATTTPMEPSPCVSYTGCDAGYPVAWCEHTGGHIIPTFAGAAIWNFMSQL